MTEFKHQQYSLGVTLTREAMQKKPPQPRVPFWMAPLVYAGLVTLRPPLSNRQILDQMEQRQFEMMQRARAAMGSKLNP